LAGEGEAIVRHLAVATDLHGSIHARRDAPAVLDMLARGTVDVDAVITTVAFDAAADALLERFTKLVFVR